MKKRLVSPRFRNLLLFCTALLFQGTALGQTDLNHYSAVFKSEKPIRIFLPDDYATSGKRYPVIYFLHGNFGTHELTVEGIDELVNGNDIILVALNGRSVPSDRRPYNIGDHPDVRYSVQFKDYLPEVIIYIDSLYRTTPDRSKRALIGHSMGGFMAFVLAGKYPELIGTAVNMKGAPEFFIGYPDHHTFYPLRHMFKNLHGVNLRFHNSTVDELVYLNTEVHRGAIREKGLSYDYNVYAGGHDYTAREFSDAIRFIVSSFRNPATRPLRWYHADPYPKFSVWGYEVSTNLKDPGFVELTDVSSGGMGVATRKWQPDGPMIRGVQIDIVTAPIYKPSTIYELFDYNQSKGSGQVSTVMSDARGRVHLTVNHETHHIGIYRKNDAPEIIVLDHRVDNSGIFLDHTKASGVRIRLLNRGATSAKNLKVNLNSSTDGVSISNPLIQLKNVEPGQAIWLPAEFMVTTSSYQPPADGSPFRVRFDITVNDDKGREWTDELDVPVFPNVSQFTKIGVDDWGKGELGDGNGNMIPEPGETIMIYEGPHRLRLYYDDPYLEDIQLHEELKPDKWGGDGFTLSSFIKILPDCPVGHQIRFLANYEEKEWKTIKRNVTWGVFTITVGEEPDYR
jgi:enterochelin esterase-like enzyme